MWPLDAGFDFENSALAIQMEHAVELPNVDEHGVSAELLTSHCVPTTRDRNYLAIFSRSFHNALYVLQRARLQDFKHARGVELRVDVVDEYRRSFGPQPSWGTPHQRESDRTGDELAP